MVHGVTEASEEYLGAVMIVFMSIVIASAIFWPKPGETSPMSAGMVSDILGSKLDAMKFASDGSTEYVPFLGEYRIEIEPHDGNIDMSTKNQYNMRVVALDKNGDEIGEVIEKEDENSLNSDINGCNRKMCFFECSAVELKKENGQITITCNEYDGTSGYTADNSYYCQCPFPNPAIDEPRVIPELLRKYSERVGVDIALVKAIINKESTWRHCTRPKDGTSSMVIGGIKGSKGLMQIYHTWESQFGNLCDIENNIQAGTTILKKNMDFFKNKGYKIYKELGIGLYNCGSMWQNKNGRGVIKDYEDAGGIPSELEWDEELKAVVRKYCTSEIDNTANYVDKVLGYEKEYALNPDCYKAIGDYEHC